MYGSIIRKKPKVIGTQMKSFINYTAYCITGVISLGFSAWIYYSPKRPTLENLEVIRNSKFLTVLLEDMSRPKQGEYMHLDSNILKRYREQRNITEKVYETYQETHGNTAETPQKPKEEQH